MSIFRPKYKLLSDQEKAEIDLVKARAEELLKAIENGPAGRERSIAVTKLEESVMWAVKGMTA